MRIAALGLHDVSPATWPMCERLLALVSSCGANIPLTLLVVPRLHGGAPIDGALDWRRGIDRLLARGCEVALHGFSHLDEGGRSPSLGAFIARRVLTAGEGEFAALDASSALARLERGQALLQRCGWQAAGFVPPAWQISDAALGAVAQCGFEYTTTLRSMVSFGSGIRWNVPCLGLSARSALRRGLSRVWIEGRLPQLGRAPAIRIALHPLDACHDSTLRAARRMIEAMLRDREPVTKRALCHALAREPQLRSTRYR